jgi:hypothetical protein
LFMAARHLNKSNSRVSVERQGRRTGYLRRA